MPMAPPKPCGHPGCRAYATKRSRCDAHQINGGWERKPDALTFRQKYGTKWEKTRARVMKRDGYLCQPCKANGFFVQGNECDHIVPLHMGGTNADDNLQCICAECHKAKTQAEAKAARGSK